MAAAGLHDLLLLFCRRRKLLKIEGASMAPTLTAGDRVLITCHRAPVPGDVVVAWHPTTSGRRLIKRLIRIHASGLWLEGDNHDASTDSRQLGPLPINLLIGVVVSKI
ncbi:MAG: nickel-type superoxide dismutase maturation protease [Cyanobacteriota bacterium]|nr:nickel-type superoxide dismutase maturation protease [Cyanobacteriota bacterium]